MCRNIKNLFNFDPPATDEEVRDAALQFVRKLSGFNKPSERNQLVFFQSVEAVATVAKNLLANLETNADPKNREIEAIKAMQRSRRRFAQPKPVAN